MCSLRHRLKRASRYDGRQGANAGARAGRQDQCNCPRVIKVFIDNPTVKFRHPERLLRYWYPRLAKLFQEAATQGLSTNQVSFRSLIVMHIACLNGGCRLEKSMLWVS